MSVQPMSSSRRARGCSATMILSASSRTSQDLCPYWRTIPPSRSKDLWRSRIRMIAEGRGEAGGPFLLQPAAFPFLSLFTLACTFLSFRGKAIRASRILRRISPPGESSSICTRLRGENERRKVRIPDIRAGQGVRGYALLLPACNWFAGKTRRNPIVRAGAKFGPPTPAGFRFRFR